MLLVDADVLIKCAHWNLLGELGALAGGWKNVATLDSLLARVRKSVKHGGTGLVKDHAAAQRLEMVLRSAVALPSPSPEVIQLLQGIPGADPGEILLLASLHAEPGATLVTGDKRALVAFGQVVPEHLKGAFKGRILCLEQLLERLVDQQGFSAVSAKVSSTPAIDKAAGIIFGADGKKPEAEARQGLRSYIEHLSRESNGLIEMS